MLLKCTSRKDDIPCTPQLHTAYRSVLGQLNWLQSRTQAHICYRFSRCASAAAKPTIGDVREINKVVRILKSNYIDSRHWPLRGNNRILGFPDASYRNNADKSSQRAHVIFIAEERHLPDPKERRNLTAIVVVRLSTMSHIRSPQPHRAPQWLN